MKIAISQRVLVHNNVAYDCLDQNWYSYLKNHEITVVPNRTDVVDLIVNNHDAFIISGGDDHPLRRLIEIQISKKMLLFNKPVIGICHGAFLLTEILGGEVIAVTNHKNTNHTIKYKNSQIIVNSAHTLGINTAPAKANVLAVDDTGLCESWISGTVAAIVWHPERMQHPWIPDEIEQLLTK
jgi:gamma-glutamyl-gamma-aminobutyrate hydrolase PuuD